VRRVRWKDRWTQGCNEEVYLGSTCEMYGYRLEVKMRWGRHRRHYEAFVWDTVSGQLVIRSYVDHRTPGLAKRTCLTLLRRRIRQVREDADREISRLRSALERAPLA
jgi:hypothetical protein